MSENQEDLPGIIRDEKNYRKMSEPHPTFTAANEALDAFFKEMREVRQKHGLRDVYVIVSGCALTEEGTEGDFMTSQMHGSSLMAEAMCAWALGQEQTRRQEKIATLLSDGLKQRKARK